MASTLNISLPEPLKAYVEAQAASGDYGTPSQYIAELIRDDSERRRQAQATLEKRLLKALESEADAITLTADEVHRGGIIAQLEQRLKSRQ